MTRKTYIVLTTILLILIIVGLSITARFGIPIWDASAEDFWYVGTRVNLDNTDKGRLYSMGLGRIIYSKDYCYFQRHHLHGFYVYRAPTSEVNILFPKIIDILENKVSHPDPNDPVSLGYLSWKALPDKEEDGVEQLINQIEEARAKVYSNRYFRIATMWDLELYHLLDRIQKSRWYWANFVFEFVFLGCLVIWFFWPGIKQLKFRSWLIRVLFLPILFFLPWYLGYAPWSVTTFGPRGGVLYPWFMTLSRAIRPWSFLSSFEYWLIEHLPPLLESLAHDTGSPLFFKNDHSFPMCGPTQALIIGIIATFVLIVLRPLLLFVKKIDNKYN
ncbi:MAG: hypothetical protein ACYSUK_11330 [Planctomycetota bacterium]